jgi:hypothetical protein
MADPTVGPDVHSEVTGLPGALEDGRELRPADPGHHPGGTHRAGTDADLDDVGPRLGQVGHPGFGHHVSRDNGYRWMQRPDRPQRGQHPILVAMRGVDHEHINPRG